MKQKCAIFLILLVFWSLPSLDRSTLVAGTTGKVNGVIKDAETGNPLIGVNVLILGTARGATSDLNGYYAILNISPGTYSIRFTMMGYKQIVVSEVLVKVDLTRTINVSLTPTVLEAGETVTIVAERPLVQMDMTSSLATVGADEIKNMPLREVSDVLALQAGIVSSNDGIHIRGGRSGEIAFWVDGVVTTDVFSGGAGVTVENASVQELQVVSGTFNAEYGQAMSGIVNIITKEGTDKFHGQIKAYTGDYISNAGMYRVLKRMDAISDTSTHTTTIQEQSENPLQRFNPTYDGEFNLNGPVPLTKNKLSFFVNSRYFSDEGYLYGRNWYTPQGLRGDSSLVPMNPYKKMTLQGKLTFRPVSNLKVGYNVFWNTYKSDRYFNRRFKYNPGGVAQLMGGGTTHIFNLNHVLSKKTFYEVRLNHFYSNYKQYLYKNPTSRPHWWVRVPGDSLTAEQLFDLATQAGQAGFEQAKQQGRNFIYFVDPAQAEGYVHPDSSRDPASYSFGRAGNDLNHFYRSTAYWVGKFDLTSQILKAHQVKLGAEFRRYKLTLNSFTIQPRQKEGREEQIVPFVPAVPPVSSIFHDQYDRRPKEFSAYIQDKIELKDLIINAGLRFDYFDANSVIPADPTDPNIYDPFKVEHIYRNANAPEGERVAYSADERKAFMHKKVKPKMQFSPRLGIAYPITDRGQIHFSYGHFFQIPEFQYLYDSPDFKLNSGGGRSIIGNADLKAQRTTQYEIGISQELATDIGIDVSLFYRDIRDWVGTSPPIQTIRPVVSYVIYENKDYSNVRGGTVKIEKRMSHNFSAGLDYTYQVAEGTYSNPSDAFFALQGEQEPRVNLIPLNWDRRHSFNAQFIYVLKGWIASVIGHYYSGMPYTPQFAQGAFVGGTARIGLRENSDRKPNVNSWDFYLTKELRKLAPGFSIFMYIYNVFDQRGEINVFSDTGIANYTTYPIMNDVPYDPNRIGTVKDLMARPEWYIAPRQIQLGLSWEW